MTTIGTLTLSCGGGAHFEFRYIEVRGERRYLAEDINFALQGTSTARGFFDTYAAIRRLDPETKTRMTYAEAEAAGLGTIATRRYGVTFVAEWAMLELITRSPWVLMWMRRVMIPTLIKEADAKPVGVRARRVMSHSPRAT